MKKVKKKRKSPLLSSSQVLSFLLKNSKGPLSHQFKRWKLWTHWESIVGEEIAKHSDPVSYYRGKLYIVVSDSVRMQEIRFFEPLMKKKINSFISYEWVKSLHFTLDRKEVPPSSEFHSQDQEWRDFFSH